jgi:signal peptidase II
MKKVKLSKQSIILYIITFVVILIGDQVSKYIVDQNFHLGTGFSIIDNFFYFTYVRNTGAAWGILSGKLNLFFVISIVATIIIVYYFVHTKEYQKLSRFGLVMIFSGMIGNLIDRAVLGYVRDFLDFIIFNYNFPVFNIADMGIVIGVCLLILELGIEEYKAWKLSKSM